MLIEEEKERYLRHLILPGFGEEAQLKLKQSSVLIVGAGGLGSPAALYLTAQGIGKLGIIDYDTVSLSNLHRQILFTDKDISQSKAQRGSEFLRAVNPFVEIETYNEKISFENAERIISSYDLVIDGSDNFATKYLLNDACVLNNKPLIFGSVLRFEAQISFLNLPGGPCYRCIFPKPAEVPDCSEAGVLGVVPGIAGTVMALEAVKYLTGVGDLLKGEMLLIDTLKMKFRLVNFTKNPACVICSDNPLISRLSENNIKCNNQNKTLYMSDHEISVEELKKKMDSGDNFFLLDVREMHEIPIASIGGTVIPLSELMDRLDELPVNKDEEIVVYCRTGNRSHHAVNYIVNELGYRNVKNLVGGLHAWHDRIDPSVKKY
ncbi:MAG: HesA/MoeB/ThiF family protein [Ignavibacteria bacterium]|nr:HesA/MoeB/ThiF family protein [Ignavibacteria bacterium]